MSKTLPSSLNKNIVTSVLTYVFKKDSPKIQVLLNYIKNKNSGALVNVYTDKNGYTTVTSTTTADFSDTPCTTKNGAAGYITQGVCVPAWIFE